MIYETATSTDSRPINRITLLPRPDPEHEHRDEIQKQVMEILLIEREIAGDDTHVQTNLMVLLGNNIRVVVGYEGQLLIDSETAYAKLDDALKGIQHFAVFRELNGKHFIFILNGRVDPQPRSWVPNLLLFLATLVSVLIVGTQIALNELIHNQPELLEPLLSNFWGELWRGAPYAISILLILGAHELGHYFAARYHKIAVTLPYFIPAPLISLLGTFGAFIQIREPMRNRKVLLDIGVAGPLAGLVFCIPILLIGLATSQTGPISVGGQVEGNSILYALSKILVFGQFLPNGEMDVYVNQLAWAGWTGLLVTALNLIPIGQLDGGHILYALIGERAQKLYYPLIGGVFLLVLFASDMWLFWLILLVLFGRLYAMPLDTITRLDSRRRWVGLFALFIFCITFVPVPFTVVDDGGQTLERSAAALFPLAVGLITLWTTRRQ